METYQVTILDKEISQEVQYKDRSILKYTIQYPRFISTCFRTVCDKLNSYYRTRALMYEKTNIVNMYQMAAVEYEYSIANSIPFRQFEAFTACVVTYNQNCAVSLYFDQYEYAGGAHGLTTRCSDTWDLKKSRKADITEIFPHQKNYVREYIVESIIDHIKIQAGAETNMYFEDYEKLVNESLKTANFYLTTDGVVIYFQQYDIAPYAMGIPEFLIPYSEGEVVEPKCINFK